MKKVKQLPGFLGFRTSKQTEESLKAICEVNNKSISDVLNYLCRLFLEDEAGIRSKFFKNSKTDISEANKEIK